MNIYSPAEDSYFLSEIVRDYLKKIPESEKSNLKVLDMGTGSGIQSENCIENGVKKQNISAVDINKYALNHAESLNIKTILSDLFSNVKEKFDLIIFNPPYLPDHKFDKLKDTTGGKKGDETIIRFVRQLKQHLSKRGVCFILTSSLTPTSWKAKIKSNNLKIKKIAEKSLFMEKLFVWKITL